MAISIRLSFGALLLAAFSLSFIPHSAGAATMNVSMGPNYFTPSTITINPGDTVVWRNTDGMAHTVTGNGFDSGTMQPGTMYSRTFTTPGTYPYECIFHNGMVGTVVVRSAATPSPAPATVYVPQPAPIPAYTYTSSPTPVPPSTAEQLRLQAQALLARLQQLQAQLGGGTVPQGVQGASVVYDSSSCPLIGVVLRPGSSGEDVRRLQAFLARDPSVYPEGIVSGQYGPLTEAAVRRWQTKYNIVSSGSAGTTGFGQVGPRTAAAIALLCTTGSYGGVPGPTGGSPNVGGFIQVTPVAGNAPLSVAVQATVNTVNACTGATYTLDYGDGTIPSLIAVPAGHCAQMTQTLGHTYRYGGAYQITLSAGGHRTSATVQVFGAGPPLTPNPSPNPSSSDSVEASPDEGQAPLTVEFTGTMNESGSCNGGSYLLTFGDGDDVDLRYPADSCRPQTFEVTHTYTSADTFRARLYKGTRATGSSVASERVEVTAAPESWDIISVTPAVGGDPFTVSIEIEYPACTAYSVHWGDSASADAVSAGTGCSGGAARATFTHTYSGSGTYTVSLRNSSGSTKATAGVTISG